MRVISCFVRALFLEVARQELKNACGFPYIVFRLDIDFEMTISIRAYGLYKSLWALQQPPFFCADMCFSFLGILLRVRFIYQLTLKQETSLRAR